MDPARNNETAIRIMVFVDRIEIISPGHLPDSLNIEAIRHGVTNRRNPTLTEHASHILPYRGLGSGIRRALDEWPDIRFEDEVAGNQFKAVIARAAVPEVTPQVTGEVTAQVAEQVTEQVGTLLVRLDGEMTRQAIQDALGLAHREHFRAAYLLPALELGLIEMTLPDKPNSRLQRYRLTTKGQQWLQTHSGANKAST